MVMAVKGGVCEAHMVAYCRLNTHTDYCSPVSRRRPELGHLNQECSYGMSSNTSGLAHNVKEHQPVVAGRAVLIELKPRSRYCYLKENAKMKTPEIKR